MDLGLEFFNRQSKLHWTTVLAHRKKNTHINKINVVLVEEVLPKYKIAIVCYMHATNVRIKMEARKTAAVTLCRVSEPQYNSFVVQFI